MKEKDEDKNNDIFIEKKLIPREITLKTNAEVKALNSRECRENKKSDCGKSSESKYKNESYLTRLDSFGNPISKKGKQKISFIDKISKTNFVDVINIESFKTYNKMEEISSPNMQNNCCLIA